MAAALLELAHPGTAAAAEKDDRLGHHRAVLGKTERQRVDPDAPGDVGGGAAEKGDGIGEARAVHVQLQSLALRDLADLADLPGAPREALFGRVGDADPRRLDLKIGRPSGREKGWKYG